MNTVNSADSTEVTGKTASSTCWLFAAAFAILFFGMQYKSCMIDGIDTDLPDLLMCALFEAAILGGAFLCRMWNSADEDATHSQNDSCLHPVGTISQQNAGSTEFDFIAEVNKWSMLD